MQESSKALVLHKGKILLLLRDDDPSIPSPNKWSLPGGGVEEGETPTEACLRELNEEIGLKPENFSLIGSRIVSSLHNESEDRLMNLFVVKLKDHEVQEIRLGNEGQELRFFLPRDILVDDLPLWTKHYYKKYSDHVNKVISGELEEIDPKVLGLKIHS